MGTEPQCVILLYRAILTLHALPDPDIRWFRIGTAWPTYARRYLDAYSPDEETELPWLPTPHDCSTYLTVLQWSRGLSKRQQQIMELRARSYSLPLIADYLRTSIDLIQQDHADAVHIVASAALRERNGWHGRLDNQAKSGVCFAPPPLRLKRGGVFVQGPAHELPLD